MSVLEELDEHFARFENHQFPGYPDSPDLQEVYEELVEKGGQLTALIQRVLTGGQITADQIPAFEAPFDRTLEDDETEEFARYRDAIDRLIALLREACAG